MKIAWVCDKCNWLQVSDDKEHHKMDFCKCINHESGVDLEKEYGRYQGLPRQIARLKDGDIWRIVRQIKK